MNEIFPQGCAWIDNEYVELAEAKIPILDCKNLRMLLNTSKRFM